MTKEQAYDEKVAPLMEQILAVCKEHKIAMLADFALDEDDFHCTSALLADDFQPLPNQIRAFEHLRPKSAVAIAETHETLPDGSKRITMRLVR